MTFIYMALYLADVKRRKANSKNCRRAMERAPELRCSVSLLQKNVMSIF